MSLTATTNTGANSALRYLGINDMRASSSLAKLSSGSRIVKASDDAAGLAVGTKLKADMTALKQGSVNATQATSLLQVADGGLSSIGDILQRMKALAVQSSSGSVTDSERAFINQEYSALNTQVNDIATKTKFNATVLLNGSAGQQVTTGALTAAATETKVTAQLTGASTADTFTLTYDGTDTFTLTAGGGAVDTVQVDMTNFTTSFDGIVAFQDKGLSFNISNLDVADATLSIAATVAGTNSMSFQIGVASADTIAVAIDNVGTAAAGLNTAGTGVDTIANAGTANTALDGAIAKLNAARAGVGSLISRFEFANANIATSVENLDAARSTLLDVDVAAEMSKFSSAQVLTQAATAMLAQANQMPQNLLRLLQ